MSRRIAWVSTHGYFKMNSVGEMDLMGLPDTGGQTLFVVKCLKALGQIGVNGDVITRWFDESQSQIENIPGTDSRIVRIPAGGWGFIPKEQIYGILPELIENFVDFASKDARNYYLCHGHYVDGGIVACAAAERLGVPAFFTAHSLGALKRELVVNGSNNPEEMERQFNFRHRIGEEKKIFRNVHAQTLTSLHEADDIERLYGYRPLKTDFIPPGVDVSIFKPYGKEEIGHHRLPKRFILSFGRIAMAKNYESLVAAFLSIAEKFPDLHLVIAGGATNPNEEEKEVLRNIKEILRDKPGNDRVHLLGGVSPQSTMAEICRRAEIFVSPSKFDPFSMVTAEAMACGVPSIVSKNAGITRAFSHRLECMIVDPTPAAISEAIEFILTNTTKARRMAFAGAAAINRHYSWEAVARNFERFYNTHGINFE